MGEKSLEELRKDSNSLANAFKHSSLSFLKTKFGDKHNHYTEFERIINRDNPKLNEYWNTDKNLKDGIEILKVVREELVIESVKDISNKSSIKLYNEILGDLRTSKKLSTILSAALIFSKQIQNKKLEKWVELEANGYFNSNKALTNNVMVPEYRIVAGQYHDIHKRPLIIKDPKLKFVNEYRLRQSVSELEKLSDSGKLLSIQDSTFTDLIKESLKVEVHSFTFSATSIIGVLEGIKSVLINHLMSIAPAIEKKSQSENSEEQTTLFQSLDTLHPLVKTTAGKLYSDGHYRQAILDTYILLVDTVKTKSGRHDLDGVSLMQTVFSPNRPIIKISNDTDEQLGFMWMFSGAVMGIRNPKSHRLIQQKDPQRTLEWLSYASVLLRVLDDSEAIKVRNI